MQISHSSFVRSVVNTEASFRAFKNFSGGADFGSQSHAKLGRTNYLPVAGRMGTSPTPASDATPMASLFA